MCEIKNKQCEELTRLMRTIEKNGSETDTETLTRFMAVSNSIAKEIEKYQELAKEVLPERKDFKEQLFEDVEKKVKISAGRSSTVYDSVKIGKEFEKNNKLEDFYKIVNIVKKKSEDLPEEEKEWIAKHSEKKEGKPSISVAKLSQADKKKLLAG